MYALHSAGYIPASDWVRKYSKVDSEEAQALWKAAWSPKVITLTDSDRIFFDGYSRPRGRDRYFVAPEAECGLDSNILTPQGVEKDSIDAPCMTPRKRRQTPNENIRSTLHERTESTSCDRATGVRRQPDLQSHHQRFLEMLSKIVPIMRIAKDKSRYGRISGRIKFLFSVQVTAKSVVIRQRLLHTPLVASVVSELYQKYHFVYLYSLVLTFLL